MITGTELENMDMVNLRAFFTDNFAAPEAPINPIDECIHDWIITDTGYTCKQCAVVDPTRQLYETAIFHTAKNYHLYYRIIYFREKMKLLTGHKQSQNPKYNEAVADLKGCVFKDIVQLKKHMKTKGHNKFYKYIYSIYKDIKGIQLINLSLSNIKFLEHKFLNLERQFKQLLKERSNFLNYNMTIYILLKQNNYECYKYILLPKNQKKLVEKFSKIIENY